MSVANRINARGVTRRLGVVVLALVTMSWIALPDASTAAATTTGPVVVDSSYPTSTSAGVAGVVTGGGSPLAGVTVTAIAAATGTALRSVKTDPSGAFRIGSLPASQVKVRAVLAGWLTAFAYGKSTLASADVFILRAGQTLRLTSRIMLTREAVMEGDVMGFSQNYDDPLGGVTVTAFNAVTGAALRSVKTAGTGGQWGHFRLGALAAGQVKVRLAAPGWLTVFVGGASTWATAAVVTVRAGRTTDVGLQAMQGEAVLEGQVLGWMDPLGNATVTVFDGATGKALRSVTTDGSGYYRIDKLAAGDVKVRATKAGWLPSFANGKSTLAGADVFTLVSGVTLKQQWDPMVLYLDLTPGAVLEGGEVFGFSYDPNNGWDGPLPFVTATVLDAATGKALGSAQTDGLGKYRIAGLPAGQVKVRLTRPGWLTVFAGGGSTLATAAVFTLQAGQTTGASGATMYAEAVVQGQVLGQMDPLGAATVTVLDAASGKALRSVTADGSGQFRIDRLAAGDVKVRATKAGWLPSFANGKSTLAGADVFTLVAGQTLSQQWDPLVMYLDLTPGPVS